MILLLPSVGAFEVIFANQSTSIKKGFSVLRARKGAGMAAAGRGSRLGQDWECVRECLTVCVCGGVGGCRQGGAFAASWEANWGAIGKKPDLRQSHGDPPPP